MSPQRKTFAFTANGRLYQSGWTADNRRYSSVPPEHVISTTNFHFATHNFDTTPGAYNASHVEPQALCDVREEIAILVSRPMCKSCQEFVTYLAQERKVTYTVGTPEIVHIFSKTGVTKTHSAQGRTRDGNQWSMRHQGSEATMHVDHFNDEQSDTSVFFDPSNQEGPIARKNHTLFDGSVEESTYYQNKETHIETKFFTGKHASTRVGPSNGVKDSLDDDKWKRVNKKDLR